MSPNGIRTIRKELHGMARSIRMASISSRPVSKAITEIQDGRMWLGEALQELGFTTPYSESLNPDNDEIAPESDTAHPKTDKYKTAKQSDIQYVKELRAELVRLTEKVRQGILSPESKETFYKISITQAYVHMSNARMWLGQELNRIHNESSDSPKN